MRLLEDITRSAIGRAFRRYRRFVLPVIVVVLILTLLPGRRENAMQVPATAMSEIPTAGESGSVAPSGRPKVPAGGSATAAGGPTAQGSSVGAPGAGRDALQAPDCDPVRKRTKVPSLWAPPCAGPFSGSNGGATWQGVTAKTITIVGYWGTEESRTQNALLTGGAVSAINPQNVEQDLVDLADYFYHHYQTYGRKVKVVFRTATGTDDQSYKADAIKIATQDHAFAVVDLGSGATAAFGQELAARRILSFRALPWSRRATAMMAPYAWGFRPNDAQTFASLGDYACKRLRGRNARWAGDAGLQRSTRKFGLVYEDDASNLGKAAADMYEQQLARCGVTLTRVSMGSDNSAQAQATTVAAKLKSSGVTTVTFKGLRSEKNLIFLTNAATGQQYHPEWLTTGSVILLGRAFDQTQWEHAFGITDLPLGLPKELQETYRVFMWHFGRQPRDAFTSITYPGFFMFFTGVHMAGPKLTPSTFRDGMFAFPPSGGGPTIPQMSFGRHGYWGFDDFNGYDDVAEIWWDPNAQGKDELGNSGVGMYRYVQRGRRFLPGSWPSGEPKAFDPAGTVTSASSLPASDVPPSYPHKEYH